MAAALLLGTLRPVARLIVNADDWGYTAGVGRAVQELYEAGAVSSATAMAGGADLSSGPAAGAHIVLVDGVAQTSAPGLAPGGVFRPMLGRFVLDLTRGRIPEREIEAEAVAQIRALQADGLRLTHFDTHKHTHIFPRVLRPLLRAALRTGIRAVRNPFEPAWARAAVRGAPLARRLQVRLLTLYRAEFAREVSRAGLRTTAGALGVLATGSLDAPRLRAILTALACYSGPNDAYELVCHPGYLDAELAAAHTRLKAERERERDALLAVIPQWCGPGKPHRLISFGEL